MDKNKIMMEYLFDCPAIKNNPLFFNFADAKNNNAQIVTSANDRNLHSPYIDGSVDKQYTFTIVAFKSISYNPVVKLTGYDDENLEDLIDVKSIIDWIDTQSDNRNFPDFGDDYVIDDIEALSDNPNMNGVDTSATPPIAKYSIAVRVTYLDKSKCLYK